MLAVALETSTRAASVALGHGGDVEVARLEPERAHASDLLARLAPLLEARGREPGELELVVAGTGPGSFTGLRVGIATALGLARGSGAALQGVPSVEALALAALRPGEAGSVLLDARGGALYLACYGREADGLRELRAPQLVERDALRDALPSDGPILGQDGVAEAARLDDGQRARLVTDVVPDARQVLELGRARLEREGPLAAERLEPLYLRPFVGRPRAR